MRLQQWMDESALAELEAAAWPDGLRASRETIAARRALGHRCVVATENGRAIAANYFALTTETPFDHAAFPKDFQAYAATPASTPVRSAYAYNLCVHPS